MKAIDFLKWAMWGLAAIALVIGLWRLEADRAAMPGQVMETDAGALTLYEGGGPLVVVAHGFAGSIQLMQTISRDLAQAGFTVAAFDFEGHGRNPKPMSADVSRIEGTTLQLVAQTEEIVRAAREVTGKTGPMALLGHSMATDIIIRAHETLPDVAAIVAISMYSDAVTAKSPQRLLVISGEWEGRLRDVGLRVLRQVGEAGEGETVQQGNILRRAVYAPGTEHASVLFSPVTLGETRAWLGSALDHVPQAPPRSLGWEMLAVLVAITALIFPMAWTLPHVPSTQPALGTGKFLAVVLLPAIGAVSLATVLGGSLFGLAGFGFLLVFFGTWGGAALAMLWRWGLRPARVSLCGAVLLAVWALIFALALDRYGAAFLPTGPRTWVMLALVPGCVAFMLADRLVVAAAPIWQRVIARALPIAALLMLMLVLPGQVGLMFTVLPVIMLFYGVFGTMGHAVARRTGPEGAGAVLGLCLAWSIAASTPLFQG